MPRLFIAIDLPADIKRRLKSLQPPASKQVRLTTEAQLHLTLHFLGERSLEQMNAALRTVAFESFELQLTHPGHFTGQNRDTIIWVGVALSPGLTGLHSKLATALIPVGYQLESRPWHPHITLARCQGPQPEVTKSFVEQPCPLWPVMTVTQFQLYSSFLQPGGSVYQLEKQYPSR